MRYCDLFHLVQQTNVFNRHNNNGIKGWTIQKSMQSSSPCMSGPNIQMPTTMRTSGSYMSGYNTCMPRPMPNPRSMRCG